MKTLYKILLLSLGIIIAVLGVMFYIKTVVAPPANLAQVDAYGQDLDTYDLAFEDANSQEEEDTLLARVSDRIARFYAEERVTADDADNHTTTLLNNYTPQFITRSFNKFSQSTWSDADHEYMLHTITTLRAIRLTNNNFALSQAEQDSLRTIESIIDRYHKALAVSRHTTFSGCAAARNAIAQARQYAADRWLRNCSSLIAALHDVPSRLAQSHYNYAAAQVSRLQNYNSYSSDYYFNTLIPQVEHVLDDYKSMSYHSQQRYDELYTRAGNYVRNAY